MPTVRVHLMIWVYSCIFFVNCVQIIVNLEYCFEQNYRQSKLKTSHQSLTFNLKNVILNFLGHQGIILRLKIVYFLKITETTLFISSIQ